MQDSNRVRAVGKAVMWISVAAALVGTTVVDDTRVAIATDEAVGATRRHWVVSLNPQAADMATSVRVHVTVSFPCGGGGFSVQPDDHAFATSSTTVRNLGLDGSVCDNNRVDDAGHVLDDAGHAADDHDGGALVAPIGPQAFGLATVDLGACPGRKPCELGFTVIAQADDRAQPFSVSITAAAAAAPASPGGCSCGSDSSDRTFDAAAAITLVPDDAP